MPGIYFPLRTNVDYHFLGESDLDLESRLKLSALVYDEIFFDDGAYWALIGPKLTSTMRLPANRVPPNFNSETWAYEGGEFAVGLNGQMMTSPADRRYQLWLRPIIEASGLAAFPWVHPLSLELTTEAKSMVRKLTERDLSTFRFPEPQRPLLHQRLLEDLNYDWLMASLHQWDMNIDPVHESYWQQKQQALLSASGVPDSIVRYEVVFPHLPSLATVPWNGILELRDHPSTLSVRRDLAGVDHSARQAYLAGPGPDPLRYQLARPLLEGIPELERQIAARAVTSSRLTRTVACTILVAIGSQLPPPVGTVVGIADLVADIYSALSQYVKDRHPMASVFVGRSRRGKRTNSSRIWRR